MSQRDYRDPRNSRDSRDPRNPRDTRNPYDPRYSRDSRDARDTRNSRDPRDTRDPWGPRGSRDPRDPQFWHDSRDPRSSNDARSPRFQQRITPPPTQPRSPRTRRLQPIDTPISTLGGPMLSHPQQHTPISRAERDSMPTGGPERSAAELEPPGYTEPQPADAGVSPVAKQKRFLGFKMPGKDKKHDGRRDSFTPEQHQAHRVKASRILYTTDEEVREALIEFAVFIIFLILTSLVALSVRHSYMFYFNETMRKLFTQREMVIAPSVTVSFQNLITVPDWWDFLIYNFIVTLHGEQAMPSPEENDTQTATEQPQPEVELPESRSAQLKFNNTDYVYAPDDGGGLPRNPYKRSTIEARKGGHASAGDLRFDKNDTRKGESYLQGRVFLHENLLLGPPRLRQIRVKKESCYVNDAFIRYFNSCYAEYSLNVEERTGSHGGAPYKSMTELDSTPLWTRLNFYRSGGYTLNLSYDRDTNLKIINDLKTNNWLDRGSRMCLVEFNLYNENTDIFQSAKFIAEIPPTGGVIPQEQLQTIKQYSFFTDQSLTMTVIYIFWYIMVAYYTLNEFWELKKWGFRQYFRSVLNILDMIILAFSYLALAYNVWHTFKVSALFASAKSSEEYQSLDVLCFWNTIYIDMMGILAFLVWIKIFKFISFNKTLVQFTTTLKRCSKDLAGFSLMFGIVFLAYAQLGLLLFGTKHPDFRNFITSVLTMIRMILGDFQYALIESANRVLGPIYFLTYILLVFFILLNMFLAIIMETYNTVKGEITTGRSQLGTFIYKKLANALYFITHCGRKRRSVRQQQPVSQDHNEIEEAIAMPDQAKELGNHKMDRRYLDEVPPDVQDKDMYRLNNRVSLLEEILEQLVENMENILKRVEKTHPPSKGKATEPAKDAK